MSWADPLFLMLLLAIPPLALLTWWWRRQLILQQQRVGHGLAPMTASMGRRRAWLRFGLLWSGLALAVVALAGPRWGTGDVTQRATGADVMVVLDCSRSMLATDIYPDRMEAARREILTLLDRGPGLRLGLMPFAGAPALRAPCTGDRSALADLLASCSPDLFPAADGYQGTAIGHAVDMALTVLTRQVERSQAILVVSDGADPDRDAVAASASRAAAAGVPVLGLFLGNPAAPATITIDGRIQTVTADRASLDLLATTTGGLTVNHTPDDADLDALIHHLDSLGGDRTWEEHRRTSAQERYVFLLAPALLLLGIGALLPTRRRQGAALLLALVLAAPGQASDEAGLARALARPASEVAAALEALLIADPDFYEARYNLGTVQLAKDPAAAASNLEKATASPRPALAADAWYNLALARWQAGQRELALTAADAATQRNPAYAPLRDELRRSLLVLKDEADRAAAAAAKRLHVPAQRLPDAWVGEAYRASATAAGGTGPYRFAAAATAAPAGLSLGSDGSLRGTPTTPSSAPIPITVQDAAEATAAGPVALTIHPAPAITTTALPVAILGAPYQTSLESVGLLDTRWSATGLPPGLQLDAKGQITGMPTTAPGATVAVLAEDSRRRVTRRLWLGVDDGFAPDRSELLPATAWSPYQDRIGVRGPAQAYHFAATATGGLSVGPDGSVTGSPDDAGILDLPVSIRADDGRERHGFVRIVANPPPVVSEEGPIGLTVGKPVQRALKVTGGTPPLRWSVNGGALPSGVRLDEDGSLRGAATKAGESKVSVTVTDRWGSRGPADLTITVDEKQDDDKDDQKKDDEKKDDQKQDGKDGKDDKDGKDGKPPPQPAPGATSPAAGATAPTPAGSATKAEDASQSLNRAAAERFLDDLPPDDQQALMRSLLDLGRGAPTQRGDPW